jgi:replicative DNA helicase
MSQCADKLPIPTADSVCVGIVSMFNTLTRLISRTLRALVRSGPAISHQVMPRHVDESLSLVINRIDTLFSGVECSTGLLTGVCSVDEKIRGLQPSSLVVLAARPSMGKTVFAMRIIESALLQSSKPVVVFSPAMPAESIVVQLLSLIGTLDIKKLRAGNLEDQDWPRLATAATQLSDSSLYIDDSASICMYEISSRSKKIQRKHGDLSIIIINNLQMIYLNATGRKNSTDTASVLSSKLKALAATFSCPVLVLSDITRCVELRANKRPTITDLGEFEVMQSHADIIMYLYRDDLYHYKASKINGTEVIIEKNTGGVIGTCKVDL